MNQSINHGAIPIDSTSDLGDTSNRWFNIWAQTNKTTTSQIDNLQKFEGTEISLDDSIIPTVDNTVNLGSTTNRISNTYSNNVIPNNITTNGPDDDIEITVNRTIISGIGTVNISRKPLMIYGIESLVVATGTWTKSNFTNSRPNTNYFTLSGGTLTCVKTGFYMFHYVSEYAFCTSGIDIWTTCYVNGVTDNLRCRTQCKASGLNTVNELSKTWYMNFFGSSPATTLEFYSRHEHGSNRTFNGGYIVIEWYEKLS